ncbi:MAG: ABC transporter permease [Capsulimonadales bacterium]|nr:ABC transporter permease [Capsulimonadales bacterium]
MATILLLTWREAVRRRVPGILALVALMLALGAFLPAGGRLALLPPEEGNRVFASLYIFFGVNIIKFFAAVLSVALAAGALTSERERGGLTIVLSKPISRTEFYLGKWIGLVTFIVGGVAVWGVTVFVVAGLRGPGDWTVAPLKAIPALCLYPVVFVSVALFCSSFARFPSAIGWTAVWTGIGWAEGTFFVLSHLFSIPSLRQLSVWSGFVFPIGRMSRTVADAMGDLPGLNVLEETADGGANGPVFGTLANGPYDTFYVLLFALALVVAGGIWFARQDV